LAGLAAALLALAILGAAFPAPAHAEIEGLAFVRADGSLKIGTRIVRLYGIYLPPGGRTCDTTVRPVLCGSRAVLELERAINGFAICKKVARNPDRSVAAICTVRPGGASHGEREDLAIRLLRKGLAVARPEAPFEYRTFEEIARVKGRGIWGFQSDDIRQRHQN
jgi:endonuclease YncB( thermonuclease family)